MAHQGLVAGVELDQAGDARLDLGLDHLQVGVDAAESGSGLRRHLLHEAALQVLGGDRVREVAVAHRQRHDDVVRLVADSHHDGVLHAAPAGLDAGGVDRDAEMQIAVDQVDHRKALGRHRAVGDRDEEPVGPPIDLRGLPARASPAGRPAPEPARESESGSA